MAEAPANHRIAIVLRSYKVPKPLPSCWCARKARARPLAGPPDRNASGVDTGEAHDLPPPTPAVLDGRLGVRAAMLRRVRR
jgi:hypothetical protein